MLNIRNLRKTYKHIIAVKDLSFIVTSGAILGLVGPNGAGKTTTIKSLTGLITNYEGVIKYNGQSIADAKVLKQYKKKMGYLPENADVPGHLSGYEYLHLIGALYGIPTHLINRRIDALARSFNVDHSMHFTINSYSKGMKQKIMIIGTLLHNPDLLFLDEPFSGLDFYSISLLKLLLKKFAKEGKSIIYSSHIIETIEDLCTQIIVINKGEMLLNEKLENLKDKMNNLWFHEIFKDKEEMRRLEDCVLEIDIAFS